MAGRRKGAPDARQSQATSKGSWSIILDLGYETDPVTGRQKRKQKWHTFRGTQKQAEDKLADLLKDVKDGEYVDPSTLTLGAWLPRMVRRLEEANCGRHLRALSRHHRARPGAVDHWADAAAEAPRHASRGVLRRVDRLSADAVVHHTILQQAMRKATKSTAHRVNIAADLDHKPRRPRTSATSAGCTAGRRSSPRPSSRRRTAAGPQPAAFYTLALDSGARKGELCGLTWANLDLDAGQDVTSCSSS